LSISISPVIKSKLPVEYDPYLPLLATTGTVHLR